MCRVVFLCIFAVAAGSATAQDFSLTSRIDTQQATGELAGDVSGAKGYGGLTYDEDTDTLSWEFEFSGLTGDVTAAHIHGPADSGETAGVLIDLEGPSGGLASPMAGSVIVDDAQVVSDLRAGRTYVNLHTALNPAGEIRGQLNPTENTRFVTYIDPSQQTQELNGDVSAAMGSGEFNYDAATDTLSWDFSFSGLTGPATALHIHGPAGPSASNGVLVNLEEASGGLDSPAQGALVLDDPLILAYLINNYTYVNVHTELNAPGEIRGQLITDEDATLMTKMSPEQQPQELNGDVSAARGFGGFSYDSASGTLAWELTFSGLTGPLFAAHIHGPAPAGSNAGVLIDLEANSDNLTSPIQGSVVITDASTLSSILTGLAYVNFHTDANQQGEIRGQIEQITSMKFPLGLDPTQETHVLNGNFSAAVGSGGLTYDQLSDTLSWNITYSNLTGPVVAAHVHGPAKAGENGGVLIDLEPNSSGLDSPLEGSVVLADPLVAAYLASGVTYVNLHTDTNPAGEIRGQVMPASTFVMEAAIDPEQEVSPPSGDVSSAAGAGSVSYDASADQFSWNVTYSGLTGNVIAAHIHGPARPGENNGVLIAIDADGTASPIEGMINDPSAADLGHIMSNLGYFNIHTETNQAGEIRGQILPILFSSGFELSESAH